MEITFRGPPRRFLCMSVPSVLAVRMSDRELHAAVRLIRLLFNEIYIGGVHHRQPEGEVRAVQPYASLGHAKSALGNRLPDARLIAESRHARSMTYLDIHSIDLPQ